jgi:acetyl-CoA C-acetyltransferase
MSQTLIYSAQRTPIGAFNGSLASVHSTDLGSTAIKAALSQSGFKAEMVNECIMGQVLTAGAGQAPARQAWIKSGGPVSTQCLTINKVCGSGLKAVMLADDAIKLGRAEVIVCGGQESMSNAPYLQSGARSGYRMGNQVLEDSMIKDGLWDPYNNWHMGNAAELCVQEYKTTREEQDAFAVNSYEKAKNAQAKNWFDSEIVKVDIQDRKGTISIFTDEEPGKAQYDKIPTLRPAFDKNGTVTAANASKLNDGGAALVLASDGMKSETSSKPIARVVAQAAFAQDPKWFTTAPVGAIKKALANAKLSVNDIDLWEINEAFAVVTMAAQKDLKINAEKINVNGGAVALGHPIGASGARILTTLVHGLHTHNKQFGLATLCIGGGEAVALIIERV